MRGSVEEETAKSVDPGKTRASKTQELSVLHNKEDEIESAKAEIEEAREENGRLKRMLEQMNEDYKSLHREFSCILKRAKSTRSENHPDNLKVAKLELKPEPVCLSLGIRPVESDQEPKKEIGRRDSEEFESGFGLRLNTKLQLSPQVLSTPGSVHRPLPEGQEDMDARETWSPSKLQKTEGNGDGDGNETTQPAQVKRARVSVRARCDSHTMNDGCQWRKYGQKISKGNPCPRAYYRCTVAPSCPVRKQVQRCIDDMSILITTYEGTHNHPLPVSATAMASTTSAAASMLLSGSSSTSQTQTALGSNATTLAGLDGLRSKLPFYYSNSPAPLHPTITLDLTTTSSSPMTHSTHLNRHYSRPSLQGSSPGFSENLQNIWGPSRPVIGLDKQSRDPPHSLTETLTKMLTTDPAFESVITAAVQSMVGNNKSHLTELPSFPLLQYPASSSVSDTASKPMLDKDSIGL